MPLAFPITNGMVRILKAGGQLEEFKQEKLERSLLKAGAGRTIASEIIGHIERELKEGMSTSQIYKHAFFLLEKKDKPVATRYSLRRAILELGPSGFPFEDFVSEILREKGFTTEVDVTLKGECAKHEIDVVAYNENKLMMVEAKFHNELGIKTDLKTILYVKARFDDIKPLTFNYGGVRAFNENWIITNTKFTESTIGYGKCKNMIMIGWNYPGKGNLQDMIEDSGLHPLTCLSSLSQRQKGELLRKGIVLCRKLKDNYQELESLGIKKGGVDEVNKEIGLVCGL
ncbi:MAG: ATP-cone domain-containing protein [Parcubacteria group bacterium Gr01-1014_107]|nr:MAG: ATP-cone domain-containing protein [Parcubacteria group bacterium Gr01-1014_107]